MTPETLQQANELDNDIKNINKVIEENKDNRYISVVGARHRELYYSVRFQEELAEWLEQKREQYQGELAAM